MKKLMTAMLVMVAAACSFVTTTQQDTRPWTEIPTITRADTRDFAGMRYEREVDIILLWTLSQLALPNEVAFCLYGYAADTTITYRQIDSDEMVDLPKKIAVIDSVAIANIEEATPVYVQFTDGVACDADPRLIGTAHTHPSVPWGGRCTHSELDVLYAQYRETDYWLTLVMCEYTHQLMWADGRRLDYYVRNPANPLQDDPNPNRTDINGNGG